MRAVVKSIGVLLTIAYPLAVFWGLTHLSARVVGMLGLCAAVPWIAYKLRGADREHLAAVLRVPLVVVALLLAGAALDDPRFMMALPVLINLALLVTFAGSLRGEMTIVERFARMKEADLSEAQVRHCRQVTVAWCVFFVANAAVAAALAALDLRLAWAVYTGGLAYVLMGLMFAGEYALRIRRFGTR